MFIFTGFPSNSTTNTANSTITTSCRCSNMSVVSFLRTTRLSHDFNSNKKDRLMISSNGWIHDQKYFVLFFISLNIYPLAFLVGNVIFVKNSLDSIVLSIMFCVFKQFSFAGSWLYVKCVIDQTLNIIFLIPHTNFLVCIYSFINGWIYIYFLFYGSLAPKINELFRLKQNLFALVQFAGVKAPSHNSLQY